MPKKRGKTYKAVAEKIDKQNLYDPKDALDLVAGNSSAKFDETVEVHIRLGVDGRHGSDQSSGRAYS